MNNDKKWCLKYENRVPLISDTVPYLLFGNTILFHSFIWFCISRISSCVLHNDYCYTKWWSIECQTFLIDWMGSTTYSSFWNCIVLWWREVFRVDVRTHLLIHLEKRFHHLTKTFMLLQVLVKLGKQCFVFHTSSSMHTLCTEFYLSWSWRNSFWKIDTRLLWKANAG